MGKIFIFIFSDPNVHAHYIYPRQWSTLHIFAPLSTMPKKYYITTLYIHTSISFAGINLPWGLIISASVVDGFSHQFCSTARSKKMTLKKSHKSIPWRIIANVCDRNNYCTNRVEYTLPHKQLHFIFNWLKKENILNNCFS